MKELIKKYYLRFIMILIGNIFVGISVYFYVISNIGANSINAFCLGIANLLSKILNRNVSSGIGVTVGSILMCILLLVFGRKYLNIGTIVSLFSIGPICDLLLYLNMLPTSDNLFICIIYSLLAVVACAIGVAIIIKANFGTSPFDGVSLMIKDYIKINYAIIRILFDGLLFLLAYLMGSTIGIGSLISVILTGPLITAFKKLLDLLCKNKDNKEVQADVK